MADKDERARRLAQALRANLGRRKAQAREAPPATPDAQRQGSSDAAYAMPEPSE